MPSSATFPATTHEPVALRRLTEGNTVYWLALFVLAAFLATMVSLDIVRLRRMNQVAPTSDSGQVAAPS